MGQKSSTESGSSYFTRPIVILAPPRSGSSSLFAALSTHPDLWSSFRESRPVFEGPFLPDTSADERPTHVSDRLDDEMVLSIRKALWHRSINMEMFPLLGSIRVSGRGAYSPHLARIFDLFRRRPVRLVEKTVGNILRLNAIERIFPDASYVRLIRDPRKNIEAMVRGWLHPQEHNDYKLPSYFVIHGLETGYASFMLPPDWREWSGRDIVEVVGLQWLASHEILERDLREIDGTRLFEVRAEDLFSRPRQILSEIAEWADMDPAPFSRMKTLPRINSSESAQRATWHELKERLGALGERVAVVAESLGY